MLVLNICTSYPGWGRYSHISLKFYNFGDRGLMMKTIMKAWQDQGQFLKNFKLSCKQQCSLIDQGRYGFGHMKHVKLHIDQFLEQSQMRRGKRKFFGALAEVIQNLIYQDDMYGVITPNDMTKNIQQSRPDMLIEMSPT